MQDSAHFLCILSLQISHIKPFFLIIMQAVQKSSKISFFLWGSYMRTAVIWLTIFCTSGSFSRIRMFPLSFVVYRLMADWDRPRISATCFSFIPCFSMMSLAMRAFIAGNTVLTPTSQGNSKIFTNYSIFVRNVYKYVACHTFYDGCHDGDVA